MVKNPSANARDIRNSGSTPGLGRFPGGGHGNPLQYSCLEKPRDRGDWWATVHRITKCPRLKWLSSIQVSLNFILFHSSPLWLKGHIFWMLVLESLVGLHRTVQLQLLQHYWLGHRLGLRWYWMVCLGNKQRSFCHFWDCTQVLHFGLFCWLWGLLHFF